MSNILCPSPPTPCRDGVFLNLSGEGPEDCIEPGLTRYSSEGDDINFILGRRVIIVDPPLGSQWLENNFLGHCLSSESQVEADICAYNHALECLFGLTFRNEEVSCTVDCPDGSEFVFMVEAGKFAALNQGDANAVAMSYACRKAAEERICLSDLNASCCTGSEFEATITAS